MTVNTKFIIFLENMKVYDESLIESIRNAYNLIYESSENVVASIEAKLGNTGEENPLDDEIPEQFTLISEQKAHGL